MLAISCLAISYLSNLSWFMDLTFQIPMQYCSLQHKTLLSPPDSSKTGSYFWFGSASLFFLELFLQFPSSLLDTYQPGELIFQCQFFFFLFILLMDFSGQEFWSGLPFPSPINQVLLELSTMTHPSWITLYGMDHIQGHITRGNKNSRSKGTEIIQSLFSDHCGITLEINIKRYLKIIHIFSSSMWYLPR